MTNLKRSEFQAHPFHLVSPSPWPLYTSICLLTLTCICLLSLICLGVLAMRSVICATCFLFLVLISLALCILLFWSYVFSRNSYLGYYPIALQIKLKLILLGYFNFIFGLSTRISAYLSYLSVKFTLFYSLNLNLHIYIHLFIILFIYLSQLLPYMLTEHFLNGYFLEMNNGDSDKPGPEFYDKLSSSQKMADMFDPKHDPERINLFPDSNPNDEDPKKITVAAGYMEDRFKTWDQCDYVYAKVSGSHIDLTLQKQGHPDVTMSTDEVDIYAGKYNIFLQTHKALVSEHDEVIARVYADSKLSVEATRIGSELSVANSKQAIERIF